ncbi:hypothetical protein EVAR_80972_1 [Eumeta japonica]|uniref:Uncharacterized protein n=1 Tax=Eumeta variegata TaxID=151549 RepID=A0A4C1WQ74_EUMVA|nr:hypothetical protein EVAR_80972_1 [Eumeta japonica]
MLSKTLADSILLLANGIIDGFKTEIRITVLTHRCGKGQGKITWVKDNEALRGGQYICCPLVKSSEISNAPEWDVEIFYLPNQSTGIFFLRCRTRAPYDVWQFMNSAISSGTAALP